VRLLLPCLLTLVGCAEPEAKPAERLCELPDDLACALEEIDAIDARLDELDAEGGCEQPCECPIPEGLAVDVTVSLPGPCRQDRATFVDCMTEHHPESTPLDLVCDGPLIGSCDGRCAGWCVAADGACDGPCVGTCTGTCDAEMIGSCEGTCDGTCDGICDEPGGYVCHGPCDGECDGTCDGTVVAGCAGECSGTCEGSCTSESYGSCDGSCRGDCDSWGRDPECEGAWVAPPCAEGCQWASLHCTPPDVEIEFEGQGSDPGVDAAVDELEELVELTAARATELTQMHAAITRLSVEVTALVDTSAETTEVDAECVVSLWLPTIERVTEVAGRFAVALSDCASATEACANVCYR